MAGEGPARASRLSTSSGHGGSPSSPASAATAGATAAEALAAEGFPIACVSIGAGEDFEDPFGDWARASEIEDDGALLVRPDHVVAWRSKTRVADCDQTLRDAVMKVTGRA